MRKISYNYAFVFYDVNEKRVQKVFKICKKYLSHFQFSVFRGEITPSKLIELKTELNRVIDKSEDFVCIIKVMNDDVFGEETLGKKDVVTGENLILQKRRIVESKIGALIYQVIVCVFCYKPFRNKGK